MPDGGPGGFGASGWRAGPGAGHAPTRSSRSSGPTPTFAALIESKKAELQASLFDSGLASSILETWTGVLEANATDLVDSATIAAESSSLSEHLTD